MQILRVFAIMLVLPVTACTDDISREISPDTGLSRWIIESGGVRIELVPVTRDYIQAVFASRGLPPHVIEEVGRYCTFGTIIHNESGKMLSNRLADWRYVTRDGVKHPPKTKTAWVSGWQEEGLAFRWLLMAEDQVYAPQDWGQGFTTVELSPETEFDLEYVWEQNGSIHRGMVKGMKCAPQEIVNE